MLRALSSFHHCPESSRSLSPLRLRPILYYLLLSSRAALFPSEPDMNAVSMCKINAFRQMMILRSQTRVVLNAVTFAPLIASVLSIPVSYENRSRQNLHFLHHRRPLHQPLSLAVLVCVNRRPWSKVGVCADIRGSNRKVSW